MLHQVIAVVFSNVSARVIGLSGTSPRPQWPQSMGLLPGLSCSLSLFFWASLFPLLATFFLGYSTSPSLPSSPSTPPNWPTATRALAVAWSVILQVVTPPAADTHFCLLVTAFFIELGQWVPCNLKYEPYLKLISIWKFSDIRDDKIET